MSFLKLMFPFLFCCFFSFVFHFFHILAPVFPYLFFKFIRLKLILSEQKTQKPKSMSSCTNISENTIWECFACFSHHFTSLNSVCAAWINDKVKWISHCMDTIAFSMTYYESAFSCFVARKMSQVARNKKCAVCDSGKEMHLAYLMWRIKWKRILC